MGRGTARIYNIISLVFLVLSFLWILFVISRMIGPAPTVENQAAALPTALVLPTLPPTNTPTATLFPTETMTPTQTETPTVTPTETIAPTSSATITTTAAATFTPTTTPTPPFTFTPTPSETPAESATPQPPTLSPFPFDLRNNEVLYVPNINTSIGCAWQGIAGQVFDMGGNPLPTPLRVHIYGGPDNLELYQNTASNTNYGPSGWEQPVGTIINTGTYYVQLESAGGTPVSQAVQVTFPGDCNANLALVNFIQNRPL